MPCQALRNVPRKKLDIALHELESEQDPAVKALKNKLLHRYFDANIPVKFWELEMKKDFHGYKTLLDYYDNLTQDIHGVYKKGTAVCFAGSYGIGKSFIITNILKRAVEKGYSGLFVNLTDIVSSMKSNEQFQARQELLNVDFLTVDEFDPRYMATPAASDFYGRVLEDVLRTRVQNKLPIFMCTNSPNPVMSFDGDLQQSISSLFNYVDIIPLLGEDYRPKEGKNA